MRAGLFGIGVVGLLFLAPDLAAAQEFTPPSSDFRAVQPPIDWGHPFSLSGFSRPRPVEGRSVYDRERPLDMRADGERSQ